MFATVETLEDTCLICIQWRREVIFWKYTLPLQSECEHLTKIITILCLLEENGSTGNEVIWNFFRNVCSSFINDPLDTYD